MKSLAAERDVPVHRVLREAGLLRHVEALGRRGETWLFPELDRGTANNRFTKRFTRYRQQEGVYDPQRDFHSLRTDFNVLLREAGVGWAARIHFTAPPVSSPDA